MSLGWVGLDAFPILFCSRYRLASGKECGLAKGLMVRAKFWASLHDKDDPSSTSVAFLLESSQPLWEVA